MATDFISREAALACFSDWIDRYGHEHTADEIVEYQRIEDLPAADVVGVVRCRDCTYYNKDSWLCENRYGLSFANADKYCSMGVRRSDNE